MTGLLSDPTLLEGTCTKQVALEEENQGVKDSENQAFRKRDGETRMKADIMADVPNT